MSIRKLIRLTTKGGIAGGSVYYYYELGFWKNTDETINNFKNFSGTFNKDVNGFLECSPALCDYVQSAGKSAKDNVNAVTQPIADFRKEWLNFDLSWITENKDSVIKTGWNKGVAGVVNVVAATPGTIKSLSVGGWNKIRELADNSETSSSNSQNASTSQSSAT